MACALTGLQGCVVAAPVHGHRRRLRARLPDPALSVMAWLPPFWTPGRRPAPGPAEGSLLPPRWPRRPRSLAPGDRWRDPEFPFLSLHIIPRCWLCQGQCVATGRQKTSVGVGLICAEPHSRPSLPKPCGLGPLGASGSSSPSHMRVCGQKPQNAPAATAVGASAAWAMV